MMEDELRQLVKEKGWNLTVKKRRGKEYFYARKWRRADAYLGPVAKVEEITRDEVLEKLAKAL